MPRFHNINGEHIPFTAEEEAIRDAEEAEEAAKQPVKAIYKTIRELEALETPRRLAEAVLTVEGKTWLEANRALIAVERAKL
jgi:hypothetical protein